MPPPLSGNDFRQMRYWRAVMVIGKIVVLSIFLAYTEGKIGMTYKDELVKYFGLIKSKKTPENQYKSDFNKDEKVKLEDPSSNPEHFDITLTDKLIRRLKPISGLEFHNHEVWTKDDPPGTNNTIEYLIYRIKTYRNIVCHEMALLTETELESTLNDIKKLYSTLIECVFKETGKLQSDIDNKLDEINEMFNDLKNPIREPLTDKDIAEYKKERKEFLDKLKKEAVRLSQQILMDYYDENCLTNPAAWLDLDIKYDYKTDIIYSDLEVQEDLNSVTKASVKKINFNNLLEENNQNGDEPKVITITSDGGFGKTTST
ncbi:unnamed protein product, partial [Meganyctiphanes norvegica]